MKAKKPTTQNRTGAAADPDRANAILEATEEFPPDVEGTADGIAVVRVQYAMEDHADQAAPGTAASAGNIPLLMDKLGERLAFERAGTRLYEALVSKHEAYGSFDGGPSREDLEHVLAEELEHFHMLGAAIMELGGDPTELTRSANLQLVASHGVGQILVDPRTTLLESLEAIAVAELADNECWEGLATLCRLAGNDELAERCDQAFSTEQEHLEKVRTWLAAGRGRPQVKGGDAVVVDKSRRGDGNGGRRRPRSKRSPRKTS